MVKGAPTAVKYFVVDAFANAPTKGNPAVVCFLEEERDQEWLQAIAQEFNLLTCYLTTLDGPKTAMDHPTFGLRWFAPATEVKICGHGTIACAHVLFSKGIVKGNKVEFLTQSGAFVAEKISRSKQRDFDNENTGMDMDIKRDNFLVQLHFPLWHPTKLNPSELELVPKSVQGSSMVNVMKMARENDLIVELSSSKLVAEFQPSMEEIEGWPGRSMAITGIAPPESGFDFFTRLFSPNYGIAEDQVCASIHCVLAPYWSKKLGKSNLRAYMASPRGGVLEFLVEEDKHKVLIAGKAVTVMEGSLFA